MRRRLRRRLAVLAVAAWAAALGACASTPDPDPRYRPTASVLEVVAVLRRHVPDDTYRFEPATDFTGRNVYRASLLRLENLERAHADALRAGTLDDVIAFAKGRALERLRAYALAAKSYRRAAERDGPLRLDALASAAVCDALAEAVALGAGPADGRAADADGSAPADAATTPAVAAAPPAGVQPAIPAPLSPGDATSFDAREALLEALIPEVEGTHYAAVVREEIERVDAERARRQVDLRPLRPDGDVRAIAALQQLVVEHRDSKNANDHLLALADLYAELAREYVAENPPASLSFDPPRFEELVEAAARLYEAIANQDGATEKLEAARRLEAFLAFTLSVDRDRFSN